VGWHKSESVGRERGTFHERSVCLNPGLLCSELDGEACSLGKALTLACTRFVCACMCALLHCIGTHCSWCCLIWLLPSTAARMCDGSSPVGRYTETCVPFPLSLPPSFPACCLTPLLIASPRLLPCAAAALLVCGVGCFVAPFYAVLYLRSISHPSCILPSFLSTPPLPLLQPCPSSPGHCGACMLACLHV